MKQSWTFTILQTVIPIKQKNSMKKLMESQVLLPTWIRDLTDEFCFKKQHALKFEYTSTLTVFLDPIS